ncbi:MAG TPA: alcohol dehydrogenase catalytic domain-containing protein [Sphingomonas sp.]|nr:alcohol dehydrogenase catalytic domain-containing protein [Sphingomonas sp.]
MRSAVFVGAGKPLVIEERAIPRPGPDQALIRVERCGVCGSDLHMTSGSPFDVPHGTALGHEYAGEVVEIGPGEGRLKIGDRVTALPISGCGECPACLADTPLHCISMQSMQGGYGEYTLIDQRQAVRLPQSLSFDDGALIEPLASGLRGVRKLGGLEGKRVAVIGAGAIGTAAIFWARRFGAGRIAAIARGDRNRKLADTVGADAFLTLGDGLGERLEDALGGKADIVIEGAGAQGAIRQAIDVVRTGGAILSLGGCIVPDTILPVMAMIKEVDLRFSVAYGLRDFREAVGAFDAGHVSPRAMIGETIGLDALPGRFESMRHASHPAKVMVKPHA